ncbi:3',5'-cyclic-nucleotide phosphodiesterase PDE1 [Aspergillus tanneri]|uniref:3',5'-cyclic-nucleotide phosphodiesterase pde1 n=1 Tax=Aspergillus tanneri TaxID=1220188 RepID=A0A5M9N3J9_9EURO|nr:3',5'-cyclic-nucleotide phosphodiesterase pde1 [Aspergillus tanneri]KAA8651589.1 3',5'-cyclic-nucleotide phosphodiesterase pde1 [Aspergillus tanneri]
MFLNPYAQRLAVRRLQPTSGASGGPFEDNTMGLLVRSTATKWQRDSVVAVDAGTFLSGIRSTLEDNLHFSPFSGVDFPSDNHSANAAHILREIIGRILITHPHFDHISGLVINSAILELSRGPKPVAALPSVIDALKTHVFNGVLWPNLTNENNGAGLIALQRLSDSGSSSKGHDDENDYVEICAGLTARCFAVSHGRCKPDMRRHSLLEKESPAPASGLQSTFTSEKITPAPSPRHGDGSATVGSSAFFIRENKSGKEIIIFGDVEPDTVSLEPRNQRVWSSAAPKFVSGNLRAIFIECSLDDSVPDEALYGHLCPRHLVAELKVLANYVENEKSRPERKRKRSESDGSSEGFLMASPSTSNNESTETKTSGTHLQATRAAAILPKPPSPPAEENPLKGLTVHIIHVKDDMQHSVYTQLRILSQIRQAAKRANLGCDFRMAQGGGTSILI